MITTSKEVTHEVATRIKITDQSVTSQEIITLPKKDAREVIREHQKTIMNATLSSNRGFSLLR